MARLAKAWATEFVANVAEAVIAIVVVEEATSRTLLMKQNNYFLKSISE